MIDLNPKALGEIRAILQRVVPGCEVRVFGSRIQGTAQCYSDIDLAIVGEKLLEHNTLEELKDAFAQSDLPIQVDVVDWRSLPENFRRIIDERFELLDLNQPIK